MGATNIPVAIASRTAKFAKPATAITLASASFRAPLYTNPIALERGAAN
jgi:hypothetical protein